MKTALFLSEYDLSTVHYLCTYYKDNANLVREYALDHYVHFGFLPNDVDVDGHVFDYETYNYLIDLFHPDFHKTAIKQRVSKLKEGFDS